MGTEGDFVSGVCTDYYTHMDENREAIDAKLEDDEDDEDGEDGEDDEDGEGEDDEDDEDGEDDEEETNDEEECFDFCWDRFYNCENMGSNFRKCKRRRNRCLRNC